MRSSYAVNNYGQVFRALVEGFRPILCVELGVLDGYSLTAVAGGLKHNFEKGEGKGRVVGYDLFEDYPYNHGSKEEVEKRIAEFSLQEFAVVVKADAMTAHELHEPNSVHLLHVDVSNTGETIHHVMRAWDQKMVIGGLIVFEGGTDERDRVDWMTRYGKAPIKPAIENNEILNSKYVYSTYLKFPGLTTCLKKRS